MLNLQRFKSALKSKIEHFHLQPLFNAFNMLSALRLSILTCCVGH